MTTERFKPLQYENDYQKRFCFVLFFFIQAVQFSCLNQFYSLVTKLSYSITNNLITQVGGYLRTEQKQRQKTKRNKTKTKNKNKTKEKIDTQFK